MKAKLIILSAVALSCHGPTDPEQTLLRLVERSLDGFDEKGFLWIRDNGISPETFREFYIKLEVGTTGESRTFENGSVHQVEYIPLSHLLAWGRSLSLNRIEPVISVHDGAVSLYDFSASRNEKPYVAYLCGLFVERAKDFPITSGICSAAVLIETKD